MNFGRISCSALLLATAGSGCISIPMDDTDQYRDIGKQNCRQVTSLSVDRIEPVLVRDDVAGYKLMLHAVGKFVEHGGYQTERVNIGRRTLTIGLWPGLAVDKKDNKVFMAFILVVMNYGLAGIPTLNSLFAEPFRDYSVSDPNNFSFADIGLIGCRKHYSGGSKTRTLTGFQETNRKDCNSVFLYGFTVEINGKRYKTESDGSVPLFVYFNNSGEHIRVKIVGAPSVNNDSTDRMTELVGTEFDLVVP